MRNVIILGCFVIITATLATSCKNDTPAAATQSSDATVPTAATTPDAQTAQTAPFPAIDPQPTAAPLPSTEPPQNASGVWHYTCSKGCKDGAGSAAPCAKCGTLLAHNAAYHGTKPDAKAVPIPSGTATASGPNPVVTPKPEPAQNAKGVWHYTCSAGCAGGAGSAAPCATCSKALVHNASYH
jgi:hypothetical protein